VSLLTPVAYWDLDSDALDDSGNGNNGTANSVSFDGTKGTFASSNPSYISFGSINLGIVHTISLWVKLTGSISYELIGGNSSYYNIYTNTTDLYYGNADATVTVSHAWDSSPHNLLITRNSASVKFYIDGSQVGTTQTLGGGTHDLSLDTLGTYGGALSFAMNGTMQDVGFWTEVLGSTDIATLASSPHKFADLAGGVKTSPIWYEQAYHLASGGLA
jgi:Concanavalin A-like lectin/glucanases superfamily